MVSFEHIETAVDMPHAVDYYYQPTQDEEEAEFERMWNAKNQRVVNFITALPPPAIPASPDGDRYNRFEDGRELDLSDDCFKGEDADSAIDLVRTASAGGTQLFPVLRQNGMQGDNADAAAYPRRPRQWQDGDNTKEFRRRALYLEDSSFLFSATNRPAPPPPPQDQHKRQVRHIPLRQAVRRVDEVPARRRLRPSELSGTQQQRVIHKSMSYDVIPQADRARLSTNSQEESAPTAQRRCFSSGEAHAMTTTLNTTDNELNASAKPISQFNGLQIMILSEDKSDRAPQIGVAIGGEGNQVFIPEPGPIPTLNSKTKKNKPMTTTGITVRRCSEASLFEPDYELLGIPPPESRFHDVWMKPVYYSPSSARASDSLKNTTDSASTSSSVSAGVTTVSSKGSSGKSAKNTKMQPAVMPELRKKFSFHDLSLKSRRKAEVSDAKNEHDTSDGKKEHNGKKEHDTATAKKAVKASDEKKEQETAAAKKAGKALDKKKSLESMTFSIPTIPVPKMPKVPKRTTSNEKLKERRRTVEKKASLLSLVSSRSGKGHSEEKKASSQQQQQKKNKKEKQRKQSDVFFLDSIQDIRELDNEAIARQYEVYLNGKKSADNADTTTGNVHSTKRMSRNLEEFHAGLAKDGIVSASAGRCCSREWCMCRTEEET
ncbi:hypothetical protein BZA70DRAFT_296992 [Myxozyma melibiosi]|uniref:Uncharacterized protein n=1 Tax=Myxozyma melibiosi TaxID=54550 RepID=A0ABR1F1E3_9ASCO